jgi:hypothetical protein
MAVVSATTQAGTLHSKKEPSPSVSPHSGSLQQLGWLTGSVKTFGTLNTVSTKISLPSLSRKRVSIG